MTSRFLLKGFFTSLANFLLVMKTKGVSPVICSRFSKLVKHKHICAGSDYWTVSELEAMKHFSNNCMSISTFRLRSFPEKFSIAMRRSAKGWFVSPWVCWCLGHRFFKNLLRNEVLPFPLETTSALQHLKNTMHAHFLSRRVVSWFTRTEKVFASCWSLTLFVRNGKSMNHPNVECYILSCQQDSNCNAIT